MNEAGIVVIGGGVIGLAIAWRLAQRGVRARVFDSGAPQATRAAAGMLAPSFEMGSGALFAFGRKSLALWRDFAAELEAESGETVDYRADGILGVAATEEEAAALASRAARLEQIGAPVERLSPADIARLEPALRTGLLCGILTPEDGEVDPRRVLAALTAALRRRGVTIERATVRRIEARGDGVEIAVDGVIIAAKTAILAAGSYAASVVGAGASARILPVKGEALALAAPARVLRRVVHSETAYLCPKADGRIVIGATSLPGDGSEGVDGERIAALRADAEALCPALRPLSETERWSGVRPGTLDGAPLIGPDPDGPKGIVYALGHYRNGVLLAPATAEALTAFLMSGVVGPELQAFWPGRLFEQAQT